MRISDWSSDVCSSDLSGVEHNLAKVGVEGSNPFARSKFPIHPPFQIIRIGPAAIADAGLCLFPGGLISPACWRIGRMRAARTAAAAWVTEYGGPDERPDPRR